MEKCNPQRPTDLMKVLQKLLKTFTVELLEDDDLLDDKKVKRITKEM